MVIFISSISHCLMETLSHENDHIKMVVFYFVAAVIMKQIYYYSSVCLSWTTVVVHNSKNFQNTLIQNTLKPPWKARINSKSLSDLTLQSFSSAKHSWKNKKSFSQFWWLAKYHYYHFLISMSYSKIEKVLYSKT